MVLRRVAASVIALSAMCGAAYAAPPSWQGTFIVTATTANCAASGNNVGEFGTILYRPIINQGDNAEGISLYFPRSSETIIATNGSFRGYTPYSGVETGSHVYPNLFQGASNLTIEPATITAATKVIVIRGNIANFFNNNPTCDVNIEASLIPRI